MRKLLTIAALAGLTALPAGAAPLDASGTVRQAVRAAMPGTTLVWWHAGGTTAWGNHWQAGGTGAYGAHPAYGYHGYAGGAWYHGPVAAPVHYYHPGGAFAAGAVVGGVTGAVVGAAAADASRPPPPPYPYPPPVASTVYGYGQPSTVINNYYSQ